MNKLLNEMIQNNLVNPCHDALMFKDHPHHRMVFRRAPVKGLWAGQTLTRMPPVSVNKEQQFFGFLVAVDTTNFFEKNIFYDITK